MISDGRKLARFEGSTTRENAPGDTGKLVGECDRQHVVMQPLLGRLDPSLEPIAPPGGLHLHKHDPCRLHEQNPQVAIATPGYLAEDGAVPSRDLFGNEPQPGGKVATLGENISCANRSHHRAGDDRADAGYAHQPLATGILARDGFDFVRQTLDPLVEPAPIASQIFNHANDTRRQDFWWRGQDTRQLGAQETLSLPYRNAALQQEGADLIDDAGALADQPLPYPVQRLQVELIGGLGRHEFHRWSLHRLGDCLGIAKVILLSLRIGPNILRRHQAGIVTKAIELAAEMMRADAGFHADEARRYVGKARFHLTTRPLLPQHDGTTLIVADNMKRVLADIDTDHGDCALELLGHGALLVFGTPSQHSIASGAGARPDHPISRHLLTQTLTDNGRVEILGFRYAIFGVALSHE